MNMKLYNPQLTSRALLPHGQFGQLPEAPSFLGPTNCSLKKSFLSASIYIFQFTENEAEF